MTTAATHGMKLRSSSRKKRHMDDLDMLLSDDDHNGFFEDDNDNIDNNNNNGNGNMQNHLDADDEDEGYDDDQESDDFERRQEMALFYDDDQLPPSPEADSPQTASLDDFFPPSPYGRDRRQIYGDRFIPQRDRNLSRDFQLMEPISTRAARSFTEQTEQQTQNELESRRMLFYFRSEVLNDGNAYDEFMESEAAIAAQVVRTPRRLYNYTSPRSEHRSLYTNNDNYDNNSGNNNNNSISMNIDGGPSNNSTGSTTPHRILDHEASSFFYDSPTSARYRSSPVSETGLRILSAHQRPIRPINRTAIKILDAPDLQDDFYLNLVDWGPDDCLAVGLGSCVYLWDANTSRVTKLCDVPGELITSVNWAQRGKHVAIGTNRANLFLWDVRASRRLRVWHNHKSRIGALAWNANVLTSGGRDHHIFHHDIRSPDDYFRDMHAHRQEVCGLKWSTDGAMLASGGNDNKLMIWHSVDDMVVNKFGQHRAAVKAIAWCPYDRSLLVSGGGTADKTIKFWNAHRGAMLDSYDTGSQVCNIAWSKRSKELVSTHGYANQHVSSSNQVVVWNAKNMHRVATLTGHNKRVLYMSLNENGSTVVTGAADETLRFWDIFSSVDDLRQEVERTSVVR